MNIENKLKEIYKNCSQDTVTNADFQSLIKVVLWQQDEIELLRVEVNQIRSTSKCIKCGSNITEEDTSLYKCNGCLAEKCL